jgi:phosphoglycolate phosphatase
VVKMIKTVIIDVDDTLCLTEAACFDLENEALKRMGRPPMARLIHKSTWGMPLGDAIKERSPGIDSDEFMMHFYPVMSEFITAEKVDVIPEENYAALDHLIAKGKTIMLLTSRTHGELKHMLEPDHLLAARVKAFYYKDITQFHKPDPRAFDELLAAHSLRADECIYIGDSPGDAAAANGAGLYFIASLESGIRDEQSFADYKVDAFVAAFPGIVPAIAAIENAEQNRRRGTNQ